MKNNIIYKVIFLMAIIVFAGCESDEDFLTETAQTFYTLDNVFTSSEQVEQLLVSCYSQVRSLKIDRTDNAKVMAGFGTDVLDIAYRNVTSSFSDYSNLSPLSDWYYNMYSEFYTLISKANTALYAADLESVSWSSDEDKAYAVAQAKFFRAYAYRNLGELFGGVPLVEDLTTTAKYDYERSTRIETYQFAIDDLEAGIDDLPETTTSGGRITKGAAQHYLCELYLAMGIELEEEGESGDDMYQKAVNYATNVIDGGIYSLMTERFGSRIDEENGITGGADVYWDLFQKGNVNYQDGNTECVWAYQIDFDAEQAEDDGAAIWYPRLFMPALRVLSGFVGTGSDVGGRGVIASSPTLYAINTIWEGDFSDDIRNSENNIQRTFVYNDESYEKYGESVYWEVLKEETDDTDPGIAFPIWWKLSTDNFDAVNSGYPNSRLYRDEYAIRLPETILLRAEAYWRLNQSSKAADDINIIRERAQCSYTVSSSDVSLDLILDERARELFVEENRWNTLLRMGGTVAVDRIKKYNIWPGGTAQSTLTFNFNLWPIPQDVIDRNKDVVLDQNPGWD